jgi:hypothetical protein
MSDIGLHAAIAQRRHRLFPALSLTLRDTLEQATAIATQGGSLAVILSNNGLASAFRNYVEVHRLTFPVGAPNGLFVWDLAEGGVGFWRRSRQGERIAPDRRLAEPVEVPVDPGSPATGRRFRVDGPGSYPEAFITGEVAVERLLRVGASSLAPTQSAELSLAVPPLPPAPEGTQLTSWCIVFRCFELLTDPAPAVQLPTPSQPAHHAQLICLHHTAS